MSSPRGFVAGGMVGIGRAAEGERERIGGVAGVPVVFSWGRSFSGRGKRSESGLSRNLNFERKGGLRTLRYILNERRALFVCGTYLFVPPLLMKKTFPL